MRMDQMRRTGRRALPVLIGLGSETKGHLSDRSNQQTRVYKARSTYRLSSRKRPDQVVHDSVRRGVITRSCERGAEIDVGRYVGSAQKTKQSRGISFSFVRAGRSRTVTKRGRTLECERATFNVGRRAAFQNASVMPAGT